MHAAPPPAATAWPRTAFIGLGRVAVVLAPALARVGVPVVALGGRRADAARALADTLAAAGHAAPGVGDAQAAVDAADCVWLTVPDDALAPSAAVLRWRAGQTVVHCSGATELTVLQPAADAGAAVAGFHPLQIFSDPVLAAQRLAGSSVAIEASDPAAQAMLEALAQALSLPVLRLPPGSRARYHAGAAYAASYLLAMLDEAAAVWRTLGFDEAATLRALLPLAHLTLDAAGERGLAAAQAGPIARGDAGVVRRQIEALAALDAQRAHGAPRAEAQADGHADGHTVGHAGFYRELGRRQWALAQRAGRLDAAALDRLAAALAGAPAQGAAVGPSMVPDVAPAATPGTPPIAAQTPPPPAA